VSTSKNKVVLKRLIDLRVITTFCNLSQPVGIVISQYDIDLWAAMITSFENK